MDKYGQLRQMNRMMNSFFNASPFGNMMGSEMMPFGGAPRHRGGHAMMPFGFPDMDRMFQNVETNGNCHSFSSSTVMTMSNGPDGRPQVYQASQSVRAGPGGVRETKKTVADSRTGVKKMAIGHHIGDRAHIMEREHNVHSGQQVENQEYINLEEEEAPQFNREWENRTRTYAASNAIGYPGSVAAGRYNSGGHRYRENPAILPPPSSSARDSDEEEEDDDEEGGGVSIVEVEDDDEAEAGTEATSVEFVTTQPEEKGETERERPRKREHEPDTERSHKAQKLSK